MFHDSGCSGNARQIMRKTTHLAIMPLFQYLGVKFPSGDDRARGFPGICMAVFKEKSHKI